MFLTELHVFEQDDSTVINSDSWSSPDVEIDEVGACKPSISVKQLAILVGSSMQLVVSCQISC